MKILWNYETQWPKVWRKLNFNLFFFIDFFARLLGNRYNFNIDCSNSGLKCEMLILYDCNLESAYFESSFRYTYFESSIYKISLLIIFSFYHWYFRSDKYIFYTLYQNSACYKKYLVEPRPCNHKVPNLKPASRSKWYQADAIEFYLNI